MYSFNMNANCATTDAAAPAAYSCAPVAVIMSIAAIAMLIFVLVRISLLAVLHIIVFLPIVGLMLMVYKSKSLKARPIDLSDPA